ncbi:MAG: hypothetical protein OEY56_04260 [Cyclobacteriaceae bacterium]|nr:hypothetical protein [Cyclobacteriaceae bacterium]
MKGLSFSSLRSGEKYRITNYGDQFEVELMHILEPEDFLFKDLHTLERFCMSDIIRFGKGKDFEIRELIMR